VVGCRGGGKKIVKRMTICYSSITGTQRCQ
jgi:hypothetical protein